MSNYICYMNHDKNMDNAEETFANYVYKDEYLKVISCEQNINMSKDQICMHENIVVVFHGDLYNFNDLLLKIKHDSSITIEAELIKELYLTYGTQLFQYLRGKFSIMIWDKEKQTLIGANDHFGLHSLFYSRSKAGLFFSTQKRPLDLLREENKVARDSLQHYLSFQYVPDPLTMTKDVQVLEAGHYLVKQADEALAIKEYWQATFHPVDLAKKEWIKQIRDVLYHSISHHAQSAERVGSFLSGGIDSTIIVSMMKEIVPNLKTFSVGFEREGFSEIEVAKETADVLGVENISYDITPEKYVEKIPEIIWHLEDPLADPSCIPLYFVAKLAKEQVDTVLSGEGADELFGGYNIYHEPNSLKIFNSIPKPAKDLLAKIARIIPNDVKGKSFLVRGTTPLQDRYIGNAKIFEEEEKQLLFKPFDEELSYREVTEKLYQEVREYPLVHQMQYIDIHTWLRGDILLKAGKMSAANDLDVRMPFLDLAVFEVAKKIPVHLKIADGTTKKILRDAVRGIIPDHVLDRKKLGFPVPIKHWLKNELYDWARQLIHESETDDLFHKSKVNKLLDKHCQGKVDYSRKIWTILMFMKWHQVFIEQQGQPLKGLAREF